MTPRKVCVLCGREGHRSHAYPLLILQPQKSENPALRQQGEVSITVATKEKTA